MRDRYHVYQKLQALAHRSPGPFRGVSRDQKNFPQGAACLGVMATLVQVTGSYYRRPGARALWLPPRLEPGHDSSKEGLTLVRTCGVISGGCLDQELSERALNVFHTQKPQLFDADLSQPDEPLLGYGTGCPGQVRFHLEPLLPHLLHTFDGFTVTDTAAFVAGILAAWIPHGDDRPSGGATPLPQPCDVQRVGIIVDDEAFQELGVRLIETADGAIFRWNPQLSLPPVPPSKAQKTTAPSLQTEDFEALMGCSNDDDKRHPRIFWQAPIRQPCVFVFGAGDDACALVDMLLTQGLRIKILDHRPHWLERSHTLYASRWLSLQNPTRATQESSTNSPAAVSWMTYDLPEERYGEDSLETNQSFFAGLGGIGPHDGVVLITHQLHRDRALLGILLTLAHGPHYIGILGARKRAELLKTELMPVLEHTAQAQQTTIDALWKKVRAPMGKAPFFTDDPWQIGLTTAYEILASLADAQTPGLP